MCLIMSVEKTLCPGIDAALSVASVKAVGLAVVLAVKSLLKGEQVEKMVPNKGKYKDEGICQKRK